MTVDARRHVPSGSALVALLSVAALGVTGPAAYAGTATSRNGCTAEGRVCGSETVYRAAPGERNDVAVTLEPGFLEIADQGAVVRVAGACTSIETHRARCPRGFAGPSGGGDALVLHLGDLDDRATTAAPASVYGEAGSDSLAATRSSSLHGGSGADVLLGSGEGDALDGGAASDVIDGDGSGAATAAGRDTLSYAHRTRPVWVDLVRGSGGEAGEADVIRHVEDITGGRAGDVLMGDGGSNELDGGAGDDLVSGAAGADILSGGDGGDRVVGGDGRDTVRGGNGTNHLDGGRGDDEMHPGESRGSRSTSTCGPGDDRVGPAAPGTVVGPDCEAVRVGTDLELPRLPAIGRRQAVFRDVRCSRDSCRTGLLKATVRGRLVGTGTVRRGDRLVLRYTARGRRGLGRGGHRFRVRLEWFEPGETHGFGYTALWPAR